MISRRLEDLAAAITLVEGGDQSVYLDRLKRASSEAGMEFGAVVYGSGGWHRYIVYIIPGQGYWLKFLKAFFCPSLPKSDKVLADLEALGIPLQ